MCNSLRKRRSRSRRQHLRHFRRNNKKVAVTVANHLQVAAVVQIKGTWRTKMKAKRSQKRMTLRLQVKKNQRRTVEVNRLHMKVVKVVIHLVALKTLAALMGKAQIKSGRMNRVQIVLRHDKIL